MPISDQFLACKWGPTNMLAFNGSAGAAARFKLGLPANRKSAVFEMVPTRDVRILQGTSAVTVTATTGKILYAGSYALITVESDADAYVSILGDTTTAGTLEVQLRSDVATWAATAS